MYILLCDARENVAQLQRFVGSRCSSVKYVVTIIIYNSKLETACTANLCAFGILK